MLLGHSVLNDGAPASSTRARQRAAYVWRFRERTEHEVSAVFARLGGDLQSSGAPSELVRRARQCAVDELVHAAHCRKIVDSLDGESSALAPDLEIALGPPDVSPAKRALYASVALGCVT